MKAYRGKAGSAHQANQTGIYASSSPGVHSDEKGFARLPLTSSFLNGAQALFANDRESKQGVLPKAGLRQAVAHRWVSGTGLLERFLVQFDELVAESAEDEEGKVMGLTSKSEVDTKKNVDKLFLPALRNRFLSG